MYIYVSTIEASVHGLGTGLERIVLNPNNITSLTKRNCISNAHCLKNLKYFT